MIITKIMFQTESYITAILIDTFRCCLAKFRPSNNCLIIEIGRFYNVDEHYITLTALNLGFAAILMWVNANVCFSSFHCTHASYRVCLFEYWQILVSMI